MEHKQRQNRRFSSKGKQFSPSDQIHSWNLRNRNYIVRFNKVNKVSILDVLRHFKTTETFKYKNFYSCHPPGVTKGFIKGEALRLLRKNSSRISFEENMSNFKTRLQNRGYPTRIVEKHLSEIKFSDREMSLAQKNKTARKKILPFVTQYHMALSNLKDTLMGKWHLIDNQPWGRGYLGQFLQGMCLGLSEPLPHLSHF